MRFQDLPKYTREILCRIDDRVQALFSREDNLARLSGLILVFFLAMFLFGAAVSPSLKILETLGGGPHFDPNEISAEFTDASLKFVERSAIATIALFAVLSSGIMTLQVLYGLSSGDAQARILATFALRGRPLLNIRDGGLGSGYSRHPLNLVGGPGIINISSNTAVVTERNGVYRRVLGPGDYLLENFERILAVIDLRPQSITRQVSTQTKDGIPIQAEGETEFRILPNESRAVPTMSWWCLLRRAMIEWYCGFLLLVGRSALADHLNRNIDQRVPCNARNDQSTRPPYAFFDRCILRAVYGQSVSRNISGETRQGMWVDSIPGMAMGELGSALSDLTLDRISEPEGAPQDRSLHFTETPRWQVEQKVLNNTVGKAFGLGCVPTRFSLGRIALDPNHIEPDLRRRIEEQRNQTWRAEWERRAQLLQGLTEAEVNRLRETARSQAQAQMIRGILEGLPAGANATTLRRIIVLRMIAVLESMQQTPQSQQFYPTQAVALLEALKRLLG